MLRSPQLPPANGINMTRFLTLILLLSGSFAQASDLRLPLQNLALPVSAETWNRSLNVAVSAVSEGRPAVALEMDLSQRFNGWCQLNLPATPEDPQINAIRYRYRGDGTKTIFTHWLTVAMPDGTTRNYASVIRQDLANTDWQTVTIPLTAFRIPGEAYHGRIRGLGFILSQNMQAPAASGKLLIDDLALVHDPAAVSGMIEITTDEAFFDLLDLDRPELTAVKEALAAKNMAAAKAAFVEHMRTREQPRFYMDFRDKEAVLKTYADLYGGDFFADPAFARRVKEFDAFTLRVDKEERHYPDGDVEWSHACNGTTFPWTAIVSRFWMFRDLGMAYWARGEEGHAERAWQYFEDFNRKWPVEQIGELMPHIAGWDHTMGVGERLHFWMLGYGFLMNAEASTTDRQIELFKRMIEHAQWIQACSEFGFRYGNHQIVETATLAEAGFFLEECRLAKTWRDTAFRVLGQHLDREVLEDGAYVELTPGYHGWCAEKFMTVARLAKVNDYSMPPGFHGKIKRMVEWLLGHSTPARTMPPVGDSMSMNLRPTMATAAAFFDSPGFAFLADGMKPSKDWFWFLGAEGVRRFEKLQPRPPEFLFYRPEPSGFIAMRSGWEPDASYLFFNVAPDTGQGHSHPDSLAVDITVLGQTILLDPGSLGYGNPMHAQFAVKTRAHSVLVVDGLQMDTRFPEALGGGATESLQWAAGAKDWPGEIRHTRRVAFVPGPGFFLVEDRVTGTGTHQIEQLWRFNKGVSAEHDADAKIVTARRAGACLQIRPLLDRTWEYDTVDGLPDFSGKPGVAIFRERTELPYRQVFLMMPHRFGEVPEVPSLEEVEAILKQCVTNTPVQR